MTSIELKKISKTYSNGYEAVKEVSFKVEPGEFLVLVGPSGCGKSTLLKMVAGLEDISQGELLFNGELMNDKHPKDRDVGMVFQNYALYPHLNVFENIAFPLSVQKIKKPEISARVNEIADMLELGSYLKSKPKELSGGQRQRVALGRALIRTPRLFLFDEPLSNLDAKLRVQMRNEITILQKKFNTTAIYVTHDQTEAMTMGTKIVVMDKGLIRQIGSPEEIYNNPADDFVAAFIGSPQINFLNGKISQSDSILCFKESGSDIIIKNLGTKNSNDIKDVRLAIRPENIMPVYSGEFDYPANIANVEYLGYEVLIHFNVFGSTACSRVSSEDYHKDKILGFNFNRDKIYLFNNNGERI